MPLPPIIRPCPHCGSDHDINARINGDVVWCRFCGKWFRFVIRLNGSAYLAKCEPPPGTEPAQDTTADATLLAEMSAMRAELEAAKEDNAALLIALREIDYSSGDLPPRVQRLLDRIREAEHPDRALMGELTRRMSDLEREREVAGARERELRTACEGLITAMVQLGKEHHREVSFAQSVLGPVQ